MRCLPHMSVSHQADACNVFLTFLPAIRLMHAMSPSHVFQPSGWWMRCLPHILASHQADACDVFLTWLPAIMLMHAMSSSHACQPSGWCMRCLPRMPASHQADVCGLSLACVPDIRQMHAMSPSHTCQPSGWCMRCLPHMPASHQADACDVSLTCLPAIRLMHAMSPSQACQPSGWCMRSVPHMPASHHADARDVSLTWTHAHCRVTLLHRLEYYNTVIACFSESVLNRWYYCQVWASAFATNCISLRCLLKLFLFLCQLLFISDYLFFPAFRIFSCPISCATLWAWFKCYPTTSQLVNLAICILLFTNCIL